MYSSRRKFIRLLSAGASLPFFSAPLVSYAKQDFVNPDNNIILGGGKFSTPDKPEQAQFALSIVNLKLQRHQLVEIDFLAHGIILDPGDNHRLIMFEKIGPGACEVDLKSMQLTRKIIPADGRYFYGHGAFSLDRKYLYSTETYLDTQKGVIAIRDARSFELLGEFPTFGANPHECQLIDEGKVMVVTNGGGTLDSDAVPSVTYVDVNSHQLLEKVLLTNSRVNTGHMGLTKEGSLVVISAPRKGLSKRDLGGVSIKPIDGVMKSIGQPNSIVKRMKGEALSVAIHEESGIAAVTHPDGNMVTFWSINDRQLVKALAFPKPRGVALTKDEKYFILSYGQYANVTLIATNNLKASPNIDIPATYITGSHIYNWSKTLSEILSPGMLI